MRSRLRRFRLGCVLIVLMSASSRAGGNPVPAEADTAVTPAAPTPGASASRPTLAPGASEPLGTPSPRAAPSQPTAMATLPAPAAGDAAALFGDIVGSSTDESAYSRFGIPQMIGDLGPGLSIPQPFPPTPPPPPPSPRRASALVPSVRGLKISENQSPRPQDRVFFTFDYFRNVNGALNLKLGAPVSDILVYRYIFGFEKTFDNGNASIGVRLPLDQLTANTRVPARFKQIGGTSTALDDMNIFSKFILRQDQQTGSLISVGLAITPTTGVNDRPSRLFSAQQETVQ